VCTGSHATAWVPIAGERCVREIIGIAPFKLSL
jgi:hypothetical protein